MRLKYLLGATVDNELAFVEFETDGSHGFSCSFETVRPFNATKFDVCSYAEDWLEDCPADMKYEMCVDYDCSPNCLAEELAQYWDIQQFIDCSLFDDSIIVDGDEWMFESGCCGQHDLMGTMEEFVNEEFYNYIYKLWEAKHLKPLSDDEMEELAEMRKLVNDVDEEEWIKGYIKNKFL